MSPNEVEITQRMPKSINAQGACSRLEQDLANPQAIILLIGFAPFALFNPVLGMHPPAAHRLLGLEFDDGDALAVLGEESLVRNVARHGGGKLGHAVDALHV